MTKPTRYREVVVEGEPREMGRQLGEAAGEEIRGFCEIALERVQKTVAVSHARAMQIASECIPLAERYSPHMIEELRGAAEAAGVTLEQLMLLQVRNQLQPESDAGCTSLSIAAGRSADGHAIVAQNWDNDPELDEFTIVLTRRPKGKPACMTATQAGLIAYLGFNDSGIGACVNTLPAPSRPVGVPHYFTLREVYEANSLDGAVHAVQRANRAIPANIMLTTPQGPADLEVTIENVHVLRDEEAGCIAHTNHCVHPELVAINNDFPELIQSHPRLSRMDAMLHDADRLLGVDDVKAMLSDHDDHPRSICRHTNDEPQTGFWVTVFSIISQPTAGRMYLTRGAPCTQPYELYTLDN